MSERIEFKDFTRLDIRIGRIINAEEIEGSKNLLKLKLSFGDEERQVAAGIKSAYAPEELTGLKIPVLMNLLPRKIMGVESDGMILAASGEDGPVLLSPQRDIPEGSRVS